MSLLEVKNLSYRFSDGSYALRDINLHIEEGEFIVISGRNGSGKTVFLRNLNGLYKPTSGDIIIHGVSVKEDPYRARKAIGLVFQNPDSQIIGQTVSRDIAFGLENIKVPKSEISARVRITLETMGLEEHASQRPRTLSGGEKRRLTIAEVLAMKPSIIALDEPFTNLDYPGVIQVIKSLAALEKILAYADRLVLFDSGSIIANDTPEKALPFANSCGVRNPALDRNIPIEAMTWLKN